MNLLKIELNSILTRQNPFHSLQILLLSTTPNNNQTKTPLSLLFEESVGLLDKTEPNTLAQPETNELTKKLQQLELDIKKLRDTQVIKPEKDCNFVKNRKLERSRSLSSLFRVKNVGERRKKEEDATMMYKELSSDIKLLVSHLYRGGYFQEANFKGRFDFGWFCDSYGRDFIKFAAENFAKDHQDIAKWLSGSNLKRVALFGCPSLNRKIVFSAKRLRKYFQIHENNVCSKCVLKQSCRFANQDVWKGNRNLDLVDVMRIITLYGLEAVPTQLSVPEEVKDSVSRLLKEVLRLSQVT